MASTEITGPYTREVVKSLEKVNEEGGSETGTSISQSYHSSYSCYRASEQIYF